MYNNLSKTLSKDKIDKIYNEMSKEIFTKEVLEKTKPIRGAIREIKKLAKDYEIYIITARPKEMFLDIESWLKKYKIDKYIKKVISSSEKEKQDICIKNNIFLLCDDDLRHVINNKIQIRILFKNDIKTKDKEIFSLNSWRKIRKCIYHNDIYRKEGS